MVAGGRPLQVLEKVRENYPVVLHGVSILVWRQNFQVHRRELDAG
jgi:hypothetical protein